MRHLKSYSLSIFMSHNYGTAPRRKANTFWTCVCSSLSSSPPFLPYLPLLPLLLLPLTVSLPLLLFPLLSSPFFFSLSHFLSLIWTTVESRGLCFPRKQKLLLVYMWWPAFSPYYSIDDLWRADLPLHMSNPSLEKARLLETLAFTGGRKDQENKSSYCSRVALWGCAGLGSLEVCVSLWMTGLTGSAETRISYKRHFHSSQGSPRNGQNCCMLTFFVTCVMLLKHYLSPAL